MCSWTIAARDRRQGNPADRQASTHGRRSAPGDWNDLHFRRSRTRRRPWQEIAKRVVAVAEARQPLSLFRGLQALAELALTQLKEVLDVYASRSVERLAFMRDRDDQIDAMYTSLFRELLTYMMEDPRNITPCTHLLFCAKNIERSATTPPISPRRSITSSPAADADRPAQGRQEPQHRGGAR